MLLLVLLLLFMIDIYIYTYIIVTIHIIFVIIIFHRRETAWRLPGHLAVSLLVGQVPGNGCLHFCQSGHDRSNSKTNLREDSEDSGPGAVTLGIALFQRMCLKWGAERPKEKRKEEKDKKEVEGRQTERKWGNLYWLAACCWNSEGSYFWKKVQFCVCMNLRTYPATFHLGWAELECKKDTFLQEVRGRWISNGESSLQLLCPDQDLFHSSSFHLSNISRYKELWGHNLFTSFFTELISKRRSFFMFIWLSSRAYKHFWRWNCGETSYVLKV